MYYVYVSPNQQHVWPYRRMIYDLFAPRLSKQPFVKENEKTSMLKKSVKSMRCTDEFLLSTNDYYLKVASYV